MSNTTSREYRLLRLWEKVVEPKTGEAKTIMREDDLKAVTRFLEVGGIRAIRVLMKRCVAYHNLGWSNSRVEASVARDVGNAIASLKEPARKA